MKSGKVSKTCGIFGIAQKLYYGGEMKRSGERRQRLGRPAESEKDCRIRQQDAGSRWRLKSQKTS
jgi:hypothetical protein